MLAPVEPKLAATVALARTTSAGLEVLLTRRPASMAFAPNVFVFPGGRVDDGDAEVAVIDRCTTAPDDAALALGGDLPPRVALAAHVAAIRELFEEAGVFLGELAQGSMARAGLGRARTALVAGEASFADVANELGATLRTDRLVPLSRWVTPPTLTRRFDARFFVAELPPDAAVSFQGGEVEEHAWMTPEGALDAMAHGRIEMWLPTSATLQQLRCAASVDHVRERAKPGVLGPVDIEWFAPEIARITMPAGGGVAGQPVCAYLVGRHAFVLVDPGDPTGPALEAAVALAGERGGSIHAIALTQAEPDHAGGTEALVEVLGVPVFAGPGAGRHLPYAIRELDDRALVPAGDVPLRVTRSPGPTPEHLAFVVDVIDGDPVAIAGDLDGSRGARSICRPSDDVALASSRIRLAGLVPSSRWLPGHPASP
jgi:glyoxylase-like metal-dependent hydrolase (beta-lactamase superfamily II)/8-oxo-dGTP pyrophosphatase MutT (NUDIX family)